METDLIQKIIRDFVAKLSVEISDLEVQDVEGGEITKYSLTTKDPYSLIGVDGKNLMAVNYLIKRIVEQRAKNENEQLGKVNFIVDVNGYQEKKIQDLKNKARIMAERVRFFKSDVELAPMNPYERMILHSFFSNTPDIETQSIGYGKDRRVVIKYSQQE